MSISGELYISYPINDYVVIASTSCVLSNLLCMSIQGSYRSWKTWKVTEFKYFSFQAWKVMEFNIVGHGKSWKIIVCVVCKLLQLSKQGQNKIQASNVRKYTKTRMILTIFKSGS